MNRLLTILATAVLIVPFACANRNQVWQHTIYKALDYYQNGRFDDGVYVAEQALTQARRDFRYEEPEKVIESLHCVINYYYVIREYRKAEPLCLEALDRVGRYHGLNHLNLIAELNNVAMLYMFMEKYSTAEPFYCKALLMTETSHGPSSPEVIAPLNNLAVLYRLQNRFDLAVPLFQRVIEVHAAYPPEQKSKIVRALMNLADTYREQEKFTFAEALYGKALTVMKKTFGPDHPDIALCMNRLAKIYSSTGKYDLAEKYCRRVYNVCRTLHGEQSRETLDARLNLAMALENAGETAGAAEEYRETLSASKSIYPRPAERHSEILNLLAAYYGREGNTEKARNLSKQSRAIGKKLKR